MSALQLAVEARPVEPWHPEVAQDQVVGPRADVTFGLERPRWDGVVVDYSVFSPSTDPIAGAGYSLGMGADLAAGRGNLGLDRERP